MGPIRDVMCRCLEVGTHFQEEKNDGDPTLGAPARDGKPPRRDELAVAGELCAPRRPDGQRRCVLPLDIAETEDEFIVKASLPGVRPEDVHITAHGDTLTIRGEMKAEEEKKGEHYHLRELRQGHFQRTVTLSTPISADKAQAQFENGVLTLKLPKAEEAKPKEIKIGGGAPAAAAK